MGTANKAKQHEKRFFQKHNNGAAKGKAKKGVEVELVAAQPPEMDDKDKAAPQAPLMPPPKVTKKNFMRISPKFRKLQ